jgi:processive 1,2-diacylglycerol beta-glucosyltransferase
MQKKRILIAMTEIGNGHKGPAIAIKKALEERYPGKFDVEVVDILQKFDYSLFRRYLFLWVNLGMRFPILLTVIYYLLDNKPSLFMEGFLLRKVCKKLIKYVEETKPDLIVADHESCIHAFSLIKDKLNVPFVAINTDPFDAHYVWASTEMDEYLVFSDEVRDILSRKGVKKEKIRVIKNAYPIDLKHSIKLDSEKQVRQKLGLLDKMTLLISFGAEGVGKLEEFMEAAIKNDLNVQILVVCGRNEKLKNELEKINLSQNSKTNLKIFGFVDNMQEFIQASDVVLGKPGASQTFEAIVKNKPIIYLTYLKNEHNTLKFIVENGMGWYVRNEKEFIELLKNFQSNKKLLSQTSRNIAKFKFKSCSSDIADILAEKLK